MRDVRKKSYYKVGAFLSILLAILMIVVVSIGQEHSVFSSKIILRAKVTNAANLKPGAFVELKGIKVGSVSNVNIISFNEIAIDLLIDESQLKWIRSDSLVSINTAGLVGDKYLEIIGGSEEGGPFNPEKDYLLSEEQVNYKKLISGGETIVDQSQEILIKINQILDKIENQGKLSDTLLQMNKTSHSFNQSELKNTFLNLNKSSQKFEKSSKRLDNLLDRVENGPGTIHSLIYDDGLYRDMRKILGGAERNSVLKYFIRESLKNSPKEKTKTK